MSAKTVLITGCSEGGIGHALALEWHKHGHRVFATARNTNAMTALAAAGIECFAMDVTEPDSLTAIKDQVEELTGGTLDVLVNNAGQGTFLLFLLWGANWEATRSRFWILMLMLQRGCTMSTSGASSAPPKPSPHSSSPHKEQSSSSAPSPELCPTSTEAPPQHIPSPGNRRLTRVGAYNSSKAAINSIADTLRVEMYPFNVRVLNIVTGGVRTNLSPKMLKNLDLKLPDTSLYLPIEAYFKKRTGYSNANAISAQDYAKQVVRDVGRATSSGWVFRGYFAVACWWLSTFGWRTIFDRFMLGTFGLRALKKIIEDQRKTK
jgi:1-acylglycerone phosphate reductase